MFGSVFQNQLQTRCSGVGPTFRLLLIPDDVSWAGRLWLKALIKHAGETSSRSRSTRRTSSRYRLRPHEVFDVNRSCFHLYQSPIPLGTTWPPATTSSVIQCVDTSVSRLHYCSLICNPAPLMVFRSRSASFMGEMSLVSVSFARCVAGRGPGG